MGKLHDLKHEIKGVLLNRSRPKRTISAICNSLLEYSWRSLKTFSFIVTFYTFSILLTFFNQRFIHQYRLPLSITMTHLVIKFTLSAILRWFIFCRTGKERVMLGWMDYVRRVAPPGIASSLDISLSNWSFQYITISLYTMTKTTCIVFILFFSILFRLEKLRVSIIIVVAFIASGLLLFTYESTQFHFVGFLLVLAASFISGLRWTLAQMVLQKHEIGLANPLDMMFHLQPWMILSLLPLSAGFEGVTIATSEHAFGYEDGVLLTRNLMLLFVGAFLAFMLELSEFLVVAHSSGLTLAIAGIFKEVIMLLLAAVINGDQMNVINVVGLCVCLAGIMLHVFFKTFHREK